MGQAPTRKRFDPMGPYSPPLPTEAERTQGEPMAVANDKATVHSEAFVPTTRSTDAYDPDVARRWEVIPGSIQAARDGRRKAVPDAHVPEARTPEEQKPETLKMELAPPGHSETDERGFKHLVTDEP